MSAAGRARTHRLGTRTARPRSAAHRRRSRLTRPNQVDAAMLDNQLRYQIWSDERLRDWSWDPLVYTQLAGQSLYGLLARDYRAAAAAAAVGDRTSGEDPAAARADARQPGPGARAGDPCRNCREAEPRRALAHRRTDRAAASARCPRADQARLRRAIAGARAAVQAHQKWLETELEPAAQRRVPHRRRALRREDSAFALMSPLLARRDPSPRRRGGEGHTRARCTRWRAPCSPGARPHRRLPPTPTHGRTAGRHRRRARARVRRTAGARRRRRGSARDADARPRRSCAREEFRHACRSSRSRSS